ncbi:hypothetical protein Hdeb2414_s0631g00926871 [Helianthus debilis subsp. tardiflorus]
MTPPKGVTHWKRNFFYVKACAVYTHMTFRNVNVGVTGEDIPVATAKTIDWFSRLRPIEFKKLDNIHLWVLRMMLSRPDRRAKPVLREKSGGILGDLGKFEVKTVPKKHVERKHVKKPMRGRGKEKTEGSVVPPLVSQAAGGGAAVGGTAADSTVAGEKRKPEQTAAGGVELKRRKLQSRRTGPTQKKPAVTAEPQGAGFSIFDAPSSPPHTTAADAGVPKDSAAPFIKLVPDPTMQVEKTVEKTASQIFDTVNSSNNMIFISDSEGLNLRFFDDGKQKSDAEPQKSPASEKVSVSASGGAGYEGTPIQPVESKLEYYYRTYTPDRSTSYHWPPLECDAGG